MARWLIIGGMISLAQLFCLTLSTDFALVIGLIFGGVTGYLTQVPAPKSTPFREAERGALWGALTSLGALLGFFLMAETPELFLSPGLNSAVTYSLISTVSGGLSSALFVLLPKSIAGITWEKKSTELSHRVFSIGSHQPFSWYFEGESSVQVRNIQELCDWLRNCQYATDRDLFMMDDFWQHPVTFEHLQKGDCEDHALWAWRKLIELEIVAHFVVGFHKNEGHAWVVFEDQGHEYIFETTAKEVEPVVLLKNMKHAYEPLYSVDGDFRTYNYRN